ncbi:MAG: hypothetical protein ABIQ09_12780 [Jatrophihabitantaceae bacterium]
MTSRWMSFPSKSGGLIRVAPKEDGCEIRYGTKIAQGNADLLEILGLVDTATGPAAAQRSADRVGCDTAEVYRVASDTFYRLQQAGFDFALPDSLRLGQPSGFE